MKVLYVFVILSFFLMAGFHFFTSDQGMIDTQPAQADLTETDETDDGVVLPEEEDSEPAGAIDLSEEFVQLNNQNVEIEEEPEGPTDYGIVPKTVEIPSIEVKADIEGVGVLDNGQMGVPSNEDGVAWFEPGTLPGNQGNAVLAGHVDSYTGPAIFWDLNELEEGDDIIVTDETGETLVFRVRDSVSYGRNDAPIEEIFGQTDGRHLNLITCSGTFNSSEGTHDERLVVYTELVEPEQEAEEEGVDLPTTPENVEVLRSRVTWHAVQDDNVIGYRIYRENQESGEFEHIESVSAHERKSFSDSEAVDHVYYVTSVNESGNESEPSEKTRFK